MNTAAPNRDAAVKATVCLTFGRGQCRCQSGGRGVVEPRPAINRLDLARLTTHGLELDDECGGRRARRQLREEWRPDNEKIIENSPETTQNIYQDRLRQRNRPRRLQSST